MAGRVTRLCRRKVSSDILLEVKESLRFRAGRNALLVVPVNNGVKEKPIRFKEHTALTRGITEPTLCMGSSDASQSKSRPIGHHYASLFWVVSSQGGIDVGRGGMGLRW